MPDFDADLLEELRDAHRRFSSARTDAFDVAVELLEPGTAVRWKHGKHERTGVVVSVLGFAWQYGASAFVRVKTPTGKQIDVRLASILQHMWDLPEF